MDALCSYLPASVLSYLLEHSNVNTNTDTGLLNPPFRHSYTTCVLFADVSGFTALCEAMAQYGPAGDEHLAKHLNSYFELLVRTMSSQGGDVFKFAGDAILAVWPPSDEDITTLTRRAGQCALEIKDKLQDVKFADNITLSVKIGVGVGEISILHIGGVFGRMEYCATGPALPHAFEAEHHASARDVVMSPNAYALVEKYFECDRTTDNYALLKSCIDPIRKVSVFKTASERHTKTNLKADVLKRVGQYVPSAVVPYINHHEEKWASELRRITVLFVNLGLKESDLTTISAVRNNQGKNGDNDALNTVQAVLQAVQHAVYQYEGSLNKFLMDDKGSTLIAVFGLPPLAHEDDSVRGVLSALAICAKLYKLGLVPAVGVTTGMAFCGVVGARGRREYSVLGDTVNLAARLMQHATKCGGGVVCDTATQQTAKHRLHFEDLHKISVKGKAKPIGIWQPYTRDALKTQSQLPMMQTLDSKNNTGTPINNIVNTRSYSPVPVHDNNTIRLRHQRSESVVLLTLPKHVLSPTSAATAPVSLATHNVMQEIHSAAVANYSNKHFDHLRPRQSVSVTDSVAPNTSNSTTASPRYGVDRRTSLSLAPVNLHPALLQHQHTVGQTPVGTRQGSLFVLNNVHNRDLSSIHSDINSLTVSRTARIMLPQGNGHVSLPIEHCKSLQDIKLELWKLTRVTHILSNEAALQQVHFTLDKSTDILNDDTQVDKLLESSEYTQPLTLQLTGSNGVDQTNLIDQLTTHKQVLLQQIHTLLTTRKSHCTVIEAGIGLGKSQLLYNTIHDTPLRIYAAAAVPFDESPMSVWRNIVLQIIDTDIESQPEIYASTQQNNRIQCITQRFISTNTTSINNNDTVIQLLPCLNVLFNTSMFVDTEYTVTLDTAEKQNHCQNLIVLLLQTYTRTNSIVVAIDDAIYLDSKSWQLLLCVTQQCDNMLLLIATRPINKSYMTAFQQLIPAEYSTLLQAHNTTHMHITPRTDDQIYSIACETLGVYVSELPPMLAQLILTKAHGNPLVVRELLYELLQKQLIYVSNGKYVTINTSSNIQPPTSLHTQSKLTSHNVDEPFTDINVPTLLQCILGCRLDRLTHVQRMILKVAAMIGEEFNVDLLHTAYPLTIDTQSAWYNELLDLVKLNLLKPCIDARTVDTALPLQSSKDAYTQLMTRYTFTNGFMRDMVLSRLLGYQKKSLQEKVNDSRLEQFRKINDTLCNKFIRPSVQISGAAGSGSGRTSLSDKYGNENSVPSTLSGYLTVVENKGKINEKLQIRYLALVQNMLCVWLTEESFHSQSYDGAWSVLYLDDAQLVIDYTIELGFTLTCSVWKLSSEYSLVSKSITLVCQSQAEHTLWLNSLQNVIGGHINRTVMSNTMKRIQHEHMLSQSRLNSTLRQNRTEAPQSPNGKNRSLSTQQQQNAMLHTPASTKQTFIQRAPSARLISDNITPEQLKNLYQRFVQTIDRGDNNVVLEATLCDVQKQCDNRKSLLDRTVRNQWKRRYVTLTNDNLCFNVSNAMIDDKPAHTRPAQCLCLTVGQCSAISYIDTTRKQNQYIVTVECEIWLKGGEFFKHKRKVNIGMRSGAEADKWVQSLNNVIKSHYVVKAYDTTPQPTYGSTQLTRHSSRTDNVTSPIRYQRYSVMNSDGHQHDPMSPMSPLTPASPNSNTHTFHSTPIPLHTQSQPQSQHSTPDTVEPVTDKTVTDVAPTIPLRVTPRATPRQTYSADTIPHDPNTLLTPVNHSKKFEYGSVSADAPSTTVSPGSTTGRRNTARSFTVPTQLESPTFKAAATPGQYAHHNRLSIAAQMHNRRISLNISPNSKVISTGTDSANNTATATDSVAEHTIDTLFDTVLQQSSSVDKTALQQLQSQIKQYFIHSMQQLEQEYTNDIQTLSQQSLNVMSMVDQCDIDEQTKNWLAINYTRDQVTSPRQTYDDELRANSADAVHDVTVLYSNSSRRSTVTRSPVVSPRSIIQNNITVNVGDLSAWDWDVWQIDNSLFLPCLIQMFGYFNLFEIYNIDPIRFVNFVSTVVSSYNNNSYHNIYHAIDTCQTSYVFLRTYGATQYLASLDILSLLIAALCHDVGHTGLTNVYHSNAQTQLALLYNDQSILENFHCSTTFQILQQPQCNILSQLNTTDYKHVRHSIISGILATDMTQHFTLLEKFNTVMCSDKLTTMIKNHHNNIMNTTPLNDTERTVIFNVILHSADISNPCKPWITQKKWTDALLVELLAQGDREQAEGLPVSPNCSRASTNQATLTLNFMDFIVAPIYVSLRQLLQDTRECITHLKSNRTQWSQILIQQLQLKNDVDSQAELQRWNKRDESFTEILMKQGDHVHGDHSVSATPRHSRTVSSHTFGSDTKSALRSSKRSTLSSAGARRNSILRLESFVKANAKPATLNATTAKALFSTLSGTLNRDAAQARSTTITTIQETAISPVSTDKSTVG